VHLIDIELTAASSELSTRSRERIAVRGEVTCQVDARCEIHLHASVGGRVVSTTNDQCQNKKHPRFQFHIVLRSFSRESIQAMKQCGVIIRVLPASDG
jgi:hypothetical protein